MSPPGPWWRSTPPALHYAPCHVDGAEGFRVAVVLPRGTNTEKPKLTDLARGEPAALGPE